MGAPTTRRLRLALAAPVLVGPTVLAFEAGGYFAGPRVWAGAIAWAVALVALACGAPLPGDRFARLALGGLALFAAWSAASIAWAPVAGDAYGDAQVAVLYLGALLAGCLVLRAPGARRLAEPVLAAGATVVIGYGLAGRLLPGLLHYDHSVSAQGRLEQPLTYWNAMGELAALGLVLSAALAGDRDRPAVVRAAAAASCAPLGLGLYTSFSRGALFAAIAGLVAVAAIAPSRERLAGGAVALAAAVLAAAAVSPLHGVTGLGGSAAHRESQGIVALVIVLVVAALAAGGAALVARRVSPGPLLPLTAGAWVRWRGWAAAALICAGLVAAIVLGARETSGGAQSLSGGATRLETLRSDRYDYWSVALRAFAHHPLDGVGAGNWQVQWLRERHVQEFAADAHSLPLQTLAELGIVGAAGLAALLAGGFGVARRSLSAGSGTAAAAALVCYLAHSPLDWDWEMPAVTLVALALLALLCAGAERPIERPVERTAAR